MEGINDIILGGNINQNIESMEVKTFYVQLGLQDIYKTINSIEPENLDHIHRDGSNCIDSIATTYNIMEFIEGSLLIETNSIINTDYQSFLININIKEYF